MEMNELKVNKYVLITKDIPTMGVPRGTLGIIKSVYDESILGANEPYVCVVDTIPCLNLAVSLDEIQPCKVEGDEYAH